MFDSIKQKIADTFANLPKPDITVTVTLLLFLAQRRKRNQGTSLCHHSLIYCQRYLQEPCWSLPCCQRQIHQKIRQSFWTRRFQCRSRRWLKTPRGFRTYRSEQTIGGRLCLGAYHFWTPPRKASLLALKCSLTRPKFGKLVWRLALPRTSPRIRFLLRFLYRQPKAFPSRLRKDRKRNQEIRPVKTALRTNPFDQEWSSWNVQVQPL